MDERAKALAAAFALAIALLLTSAMMFIYFGLFAIAFNKAHGIVGGFSLGILLVHWLLSQHGC